MYTGNHIADHSYIQDIIRAQDLQMSIEVKCPICYELVDEEEITEFYNADLKCMERGCSTCKKETETNNQN